MAKNPVEPAKPELGMPPEKIEKLLNLALVQGKHYREIGRMLGLPPNVVAYYTGRALAQDGMKYELRRRELGRLEELRFELDEMIADGDLRAIRESLRVSESIRKLMGLDQPVAVDVNTTVTKPIETIEVNMPSNAVVVVDAEATEKTE
ncbi:MAG: hypothetical protein HF312_15725 [Ignavibacteria bacterium]|jgi:hypothetical protein|nr:hypothetical protein [Ignavibacteria bacterium]